MALPARRLDEFYGISPGGHRLTRADLEGLLKRAADIIRTMVDYRFILLLLFLKRLSDVWVDEYEEEMADLVAKRAQRPTGALSPLRRPSPVVLFGPA